MYNLRKIMTTAWRLYRGSEGLSFAECLRRAWMMAKAAPENARRIEAARAEAGICEEVNTWAGWKRQNREVIHGQRALFQTVLIWASKGSGQVYKASFFGISQTAEVAEA